MGNDVVYFDDECVNELEQSLNEENSINTGVQMLTEQTLAMLNGLTIKIHPKEHPPPHFHVDYNEFSNSYRIDNCQPLHNGPGLDKYYRKIYKWFVKNKSKLIKFWNENRPENCPVGKIKM